MRRRLTASLLLLIAATSACSPDGRPQSTLGPGPVSFHVTFDLATFAGHQGQHARRCSSKPYVESALSRQSRPPRLSVTTASTTTAEQNRALHRCYLVISSAQVDVRPGGSRSGAYWSELQIEYDDR